MLAKPENKKILDFEETLEFINEVFNDNFDISNTKYKEIAATYYEPGEIDYDYELENEEINFDISKLTLKGEIDGESYDLTKGEYPKDYFILHFNNNEFEITPISEKQRVDNKNVLTITLPDDLFSEQKFIDTAIEVCEENAINQAEMAVDQRYEERRDMELFGM